MSKAPCHAGPVMKYGMEKIVEGAVKKVRDQEKFCPVTLEPELEEEAALMTPEERLALAEKLRRWARQLEVSAYIMKAISRRRARPRTPSLKALPNFVARQN
jgi:hypothetical protein